MRSARAFRRALATVAVAGVVVPFSGTASAHPDPLCRLYWPEEDRPSVTDNGNGTYTVDPGERPQWVC